MNRGIEAGLLRFPGEIERIDRDAVPAEPGPRIERHEAERLGRRGVDDFPDVEPSPSHISAISFTRPMFTVRNVFSSSFTISAARGELTGTIVSIAARIQRRASIVESAPTPPTTFGTLCVLNVGLPGSTRSGEKARKKSLPAFSPRASSIGFTSSSVVPG